MIRLPVFIEFWLIHRLDVQLLTLAIASEACMMTKPRSDSSPFDLLRRLTFSSSTFCAVLEQAFNVLSEVRNCWLPLTTHDEHIDAAVEDLTT
jgi:hypothetical protein